MMEEGQEDQQDVVADYFRTPNASQIKFKENAAAVREDECRATIGLNRQNSAVKQGLEAF